MKVVFIKEAEGHKIGEIREVKPGYARNFLIPRGLAVSADDPKGVMAIKEAENKMAHAEAEIEELKEKLMKYEDLVLVFKRKLTGKGGLYSAVKESDIAKEFLAKTKIPSEKVELAEPIKEIGEQSVEIKLAYGLSLFVTLKIEGEK